MAVEHLWPGPTSQGVCYLKSSADGLFPNPDRVTYTFSGTRARRCLAVCTARKLLLRAQGGFDTTLHSVPLVGCCMGW